MRHSRKEKDQRNKAFWLFITNNPPKMSDKFSAADIERVIGYAKIAFTSGFSTGENAILKRQRFMSLTSFHQKLFGGKSGSPTSTPPACSTSSSTPPATTA